MDNPLVTILIPNYRTLKLTKLCLRLLKKHTDLSKINVIVIDNDSQDESVEYLRTLDWITLIERKPEEDDTPPLSHCRALDMGLSQVTTPYFLSIHTDTFVTDPQWLDVLLKEIEKSPAVGGVGSWKLESKPAWKRFLKTLESYWQRFYFKLIGKQHKIAGAGKNYYFLRSHCALYRKDLFDDFGLTFSEGNECAGKLVHKALVDKGYQMVFLESEYLSKYMDHLNHATLILNPELGSKKKTIDKGLKRIKWKLASLNAEKILADDSLD